MLETLAFCPLGRNAGVFAFKESLVISARVDDERFWHKSRFETRRHTLCISRVSNRRVGTKNPTATADDIISDSLKNGRVFGHRKLFVFGLQQQSTLRIGRTEARIHPVCLSQTNSLFRRTQKPVRQQVVPHSFRSYVEGITRHTQLFRCSRV